MRVSGWVVWILAATTCGVSHQAANAAAPPVALCPTQLTSKTQLPAGARVLGNVEETLALWEAEVSLGTPSDIGEDRVLSTWDPDEDRPLPAKRHLYRYEIRPDETDTPGEIERFMLACSYGASAEFATANGERSAMLLLPLPYRADVRCDVIHDNGDPLQKRPLIAASCEAAE